MYSAVDVQWNDITVIIKRLSVRMAYQQMIYQHDGIVSTVIYSTQTLLRHYVTRQRPYFVVKYTVLSALHQRRC